MSEELLLEALKKVSYPGFSRDIVSFGLVRELKLEDGHATVLLAITTADASVPSKLNEACEAALLSVPGVEKATVNISVNITRAPAEAPKEESKPALSGVMAVLAVASGKGGVGKSTVSVNIACAIDRILKDRPGYKGVGVLDCDIYGPSVPLMLGANGRPGVVNGRIMPEIAQGMKIMSMGLLLDEDSPVVWRGPMVSNAIGQFLREVDWGDLNLLVVDLPPGTGDAQLALVQNIPVAGALVVTTPQTAAVNVARRGARMFDKVNVPLVGVVENMSYMLMPDGSRSDVFGTGGGQATADALNTELLAEVPLEVGVRIGSDEGLPVTISAPDSPAAKEFYRAARAVLARLGLIN
ncbi:MAG: Mrp/NBP35 family ATP-binding protein [Opitutales bacterium]|nr:Mrp/NBP35 family ATP-binding protein [Opitutales bacterium]